jgi:DNA-binding MarR family transcriptional regulator
MTAVTADLRILLKAIRRLARATEIQSRRIDREIGLTLPQLVVLGCVRDLGEGTGRAIAGEADLSPATVVGILDKLEAKGLIVRARSTDDRRVVRTRLTQAGDALLARAPAPLGAAFETAYARLEAGERSAILDGFRRVAELVAEDTMRPDEPESAEAADGSTL